MKQNKKIRTATKNGGTHIFFAARKKFPGLLENSFLDCKKGFTLVEIIIVIGIIALLAAIAIPNLLRARVNSNESVAQATLKAISNALEMYAISNEVYPTATSLLIGASPPYLSKDYFAGTHKGYVYTSSLAVYTYSVTAVPVTSSHGTASYTISTAGLLIKN